MCANNLEVRLSETTAAYDLNMPNGNFFYYHDNLDVRQVSGESVDLFYLESPFNSTGRTETVTRRGE